jgi:hypothetical protein
LCFEGTVSINGGDQDDAVVIVVAPLDELLL